MLTENITALLSEDGFEFIKQNGVNEYISYFKSVVSRKLEAKTITETAAKVAISRAEAIAIYCFNN